MSSEVKENKINEITKQEIREYLSSDQSINAGVVLISLTNNVIKLGAMNPIYQKVIDIKSDLENKFSLEVEVAQISTSEWEKWSSDISVKQDISNESVNIDDQIHQNSSNFNEESQEINQNTNIEIKKENKNGEKSLNSSLLQEMLNNEFSKELNGNNDDKFDFFDEESDLEDEDELDIIEDSELQDNEDPVIKAAGSILSTCSRLKASDIHAEPLEDRMRIRYRIDGVLKEVYSLPKAKAKAITSRLKVMSKLDIAEKRLPQDGRIRCRINEVVSDFRVSTLPGKWGEKIVLRALQSDSSMLDLDKLISSKHELSMVRDMGSSPYLSLIHI